MIYKLANLAMVPLVFLNIFSGIVAFIWLALLGEWQIIGFGALGLFLGHIVISILIFPGLIFTFPAILCEKIGIPSFALFFVTLSLIYTNVIFCLWCVGSFYYFTEIAASSILIPALLWSYNVATGPISFLASKELENHGTQIVNFFVQIACFCLLIQIMFFNSDLLNSLLFFVIIMCVGTFFNVKVSLSNGMNIKEFDERK